MNKFQLEYGGYGFVGMDEKVLLPASADLEAVQKQADRLKLLAMITKYEYQCAQLLPLAKDEKTTNKVATKLRGITAQLSAYAKKSWKEVMHGDFAAVVAGYVDVAEKDGKKNEATTKGKKKKDAGGDDDGSDSSDDEPPKKKAKKEKSANKEKDAKKEKESVGKKEKKAKK